MSSLRSLLLLVIAGGLALFVLQNWTPVLPLVILGVPTQAIPLAFWMMGAIAFGAITTIVIAALFRITAFTAAPRKRRRKGRYPPGSASQSPLPPDVSPSNGRGIDPMDVPYGVSNSPRTTIQSDDDWEPQPREVWDDWETPVSGDREEQYRSIDDRQPVDFRMSDRAGDRSEDFRPEDFRREEYAPADDFRPEEPQRDEEPVFYREDSS
ncbi:MAG: hypothetical protein F6K28_58175, partial [Microcoleus sp. SIO2G3]|nr:hypothetical protein [Microcoleus sp. SIO2G3]